MPDLYDDATVEAAAKAAWLADMRHAGVSSEAVNERANLWDEHPHSPTMRAWRRQIRAALNAAAPLIAAKATRAAETLARVVEQQNRDVLAVTGAHDLVDRETGDGDWGAVWDRLHSLRADAWDEGHRFTGYEPAPGENPYREPRP